MKDKKFLSRSDFAISSGAMLNPNPIRSNERKHTEWAVDWFGEKEYTVNGRKFVVVFGRAVDCNENGQPTQDLYDIYDKETGQKHKFNVLKGPNSEKELMQKLEALSRIAIKDLDKG